MARTHPRPRLLAIRWLALAVGLALMAGACSQSGEFPSATGESASKPKVKVTVAPRQAKVPQWVTDGFAEADREIALRTPLTRPNLSETVDKTKLPPKSEFITLMAAAGINQRSASCMYDGISQNAQVSKSAGVLINALAEAPQNGRTQASTGVVDKLDQGQIQQFLVAVAPCMDSQTLLALLAVLGGRNTQGLGNIDSRLDGLTAAQIAAIAAAAGPNPTPEGIATAAAAVGVSLTAPQLAALEAALLAGGGAALNLLNPHNQDLSNIDPAKIGPAGVASLLFAVASGLTETQRQQLLHVANLDLSKVHLQVDANKITTPQGGALLLLLLPFISAQVAPNTGGPPPGSDPNQVYVPPGTDLSAINPLNFVNRENFVAGLAGQGIIPGVANCLYDKLRTIDPRLIGLSFTGGSLTGGSQVLLAAAACVLSS
jgi:hypothetical protein